MLIEDRRYRTDDLAEVRDSLKLLARARLPLGRCKDLCVDMQSG